VDHDTNKEYSAFSLGLKKILKADPKVVKAAMEAEKQERADGRGPRKKGKKLTGDANVKDINGNNAAIVCPVCSKPFVFSVFLDKSKGRKCPHCGQSSASVHERHISVTKDGSK